MPIPSRTPPGFSYARYNDPVYGHDAMLRAKARGRGGRDGRLRNFVRIQARDCMDRRAELKHQTRAVSYTPGTGAGAVDAYTIVSQGTTAGTRIGNSIRLQAFNLFGDLNLPAASGSDTVRVMVVLDTETKGAAPSVTDILTSASVLSSHNLTNVSCPGRTKNRFQVLRDRSYHLDNGAGTVTTANLPIRMKVPLRCQTFYNGNAGTVSDLLKNHIWVLVITANGLANVYLQGQICWIDQ